MDWDGGGWGSDDHGGLDDIFVPRDPVSRDPVPEGIPRTVPDRPVAPKPARRRTGRLARWLRWRVLEVTPPASRTPPTVPWRLEVGARVRVTGFGTRAHLGAITAVHTTGFEVTLDDGRVVHRSERQIDPA